ncbi:MAG TPA: acylphosphatase [Bacteroidia bacterium]|jgi:acylphosphatase|nr:acylphosphatase [Bacteroidia bacterium]
MKRLRIIVKGKVQGVYFRATTETVATTLELTGFVRNERDGSVYIEAQGNEEPLARFVEWCKRGPERAKVEELLIEEIIEMEEDGFTMRR